MYLTDSKFNTCVIHTEDYLIFSVNSALIKKFYLDKYFEITKNKECNHLQELSIPQEME